MMRRMPLATIVHPPASDNDILRISCSCANELVDAIHQPARRTAPALKTVLHRYGRALGLGGRDMQDALQADLEGRPASAASAAAAAAASARSRPARPAPASAAQREVEVSGKAR